MIEIAGLLKARYASGRCFGVNLFTKNITSNNLLHPRFVSLHSSTLSFRGGFGSRSICRSQCQVPQAGLC